MSERVKTVEPSTTKRAFSCPHCGALAQQFWRNTFCIYQKPDREPLRIYDVDEAVKHFAGPIDDPDQREEMIDYINKLAKGEPFIGEKYTSSTVYNLHSIDVSECNHCKRLAVWVHDQMVWPHASEAPQPNVDMPEDVRIDFEEAGRIVGASPRGAAALLRLVIQKLCKHLGEEGKNLNSDIGALVKKGLDPRVQKMLDSVRVIGNNAVHPGAIDMRDDRSTADALFQLVNHITDIMISQPRAVDEIYSRIGDSARDQIERRDKKST